MADLDYAEKPVSDDGSRIFARHSLDRPRCVPRSWHNVAGRVNRAPHSMSEPGDSFISVLAALCQDLGYTGGLKKVEKKFGINWSARVRDVDGFEAVRLWHRWERGDRAALDTLLEYAAADVENLAPLARKACRESAKELGFH